MKWKTWLLVIDTVAAVVIAALVDVVWPDKFTNVEQYFLGLLVLIALTGIETAYLASESLETNRVAVTQLQHEVKLWEARSELDQRLQEVRRLFHELQEGRLAEVDLFCSYHDKKLVDLESSLRDALGKKQVQIDETMIAVTTWLLDSTMLGRPTDVFRAVLPLTSEDFFFDVHTRRYFTQMYRLVEEGRSAGVRRLVVWTDASALNSSRIQRLIAFHNATEKYEIRGIDRATFTRLLRDYKIQHLISDFGIYGEGYLYKALTNQPDEIVGQYSKDPVEIQAFTACFEACWEAAKPLKHSLPDPASTVEWVFDDADDEDDNSAEASTVASDRSAGADVRTDVASEPVDVASEPVDVASEAKEDVP